MSDRVIIGLHDYEADGQPVSDDERSLPVGAVVKVWSPDIHEAFWVRIAGIVDGEYDGRIDNKLLSIENSFGKSLRFGPQHIKEVAPESWWAKN